MVTSSAHHWDLLVNLQGSEETLKVSLRRDRADRPLGGWGATNIWERGDVDGKGWSPVLINQSKHGARVPGGRMGREDVGLKAERLKVLVQASL